MLNAGHSCAFSSTETAFCFMTEVIDQTSEQVAINAFPSRNAMG